MTYTYEFSAPLLDLSKGKLYIPTKDRKIIETNATPQLLSTYISHLRLAGEGTLLRKKPLTHEEKEFLRTYKQLNYIITKLTNRAISD